MRRLMLLAALALAGCIPAPERPEITASTPDAVTIHYPRGRENFQGAESMASAYCAERGRAAHLTYNGQENIKTFVLRYECVSRGR